MTPPARRAYGAGMGEHDDESQENDVPEQADNDEIEESPIRHRYKPNREPVVTEWRDIP